jgi:hypothetical protein
MPAVMVDARTATNLRRAADLGQESASAGGGDLGDAAEHRALPAAWN